MGDKNRVSVSQPTGGTSTAPQLPTPFVSKHVLLRRSEVVFCVVICALAIVVAMIVHDTTNKVEIALRKTEFVSLSRAVSASLQARLEQVYSTTGLISHLASGSQVQNSTEKILHNFNTFMVRLDTSEYGGKTRKWTNIVQVVPGDQRAEFEAEMNKLREVWVPEWANRAEDKRIQIRHPNWTYADAPEGQEVYAPTIYHFPPLDDVFLWDPTEYDPVHPNWTQIDQSITTKCVAPAYSRTVIEEEYPVFVRCFARVTGPRANIWSPSWALRIGYVLNEGLRSIVPENLHEFEYSMFDITGLTPEQYTLEGLYVHASTFREGEIDVVSPFQSSIKGHEQYTVQDARNKAYKMLMYENTVDYANRNYLVVATGTSKTFQNSLSFSYLYSLISFLAFMFFAAFLAVCFVTKNKAQRDQRLKLTAAHTTIAGQICYAMFTPLQSILFTAKAIHDAMDQLVSSSDDDCSGDEDTGIMTNRSGFSEMNKRNIKELAEAVSVLDATAGSMYDLINSFMGVDQLSGSDRPLNVRRCDCISVAEMVFAQHRIIHRDHLDMKMVNEIGLCVMNLDVVRFRQVLSNGFGNSCKVTSTGYVNFVIRWTSPEHEFVEFMIEDSGPGLAGVDPEKLFIEYERGAKAASVKSETASTGLGLTISRKIAIKFGGTLHLEDREATDGVSGARFVFRLPTIAMVKTPEAFKPKAIPDVKAVLDATTGSMYDFIKGFMGFDSVRTCDCISIASMVLDEHHTIHRDHLDMTMVNEVGSCVMNVDEIGFKQVLTNGFRNSCKITPAGYVNLYVRWTSLQHEIVEFIIEDSGPGLMGVDPEILFMECKRGRQSSNVNSGLGLTISRKIALNFGGSLHLEDREGTDGVSGTRFVFRLPAGAMVEAPEAHETDTRFDTKANSIPAAVVPAGGTVQPGISTPTSSAAVISSEQVDYDENEAPAAESVSDIQKRPIDMTKVKVAFAEDDPVNHAILKRMLSRIGCQLVGAFYDGQPIRDLLCNNNNNNNNIKIPNNNNNNKTNVVLPDVVLLDVGMLHMNGDVAVREIREAGCALQCVAVTGRTFLTDLKHFMESGFNAIVHKPYSTEDLETVIMKCVLTAERKNHVSVV